MAALAAQAPAAAESVIGIDIALAHERAVPLSQRRQLVPPLAQRLIQIDVRREQPRRRLVVPALDQ